MSLCRLRSIAGRVGIYLLCTASLIHLYTNLILCVIHPVLCCYFISMFIGSGIRFPWERGRDVLESKVPGCVAIWCMDDICLWYRAQYVKAAPICEVLGFVALTDWNTRKFKQESYLHANSIYLHTQFHSSPNTNSITRQRASTLSLIPIIFCDSLCEPIISLLSDCFFHCWCQLSFQSQSHIQFSPLFSHLQLSH